MTWIVRTQLKSRNLVGNSESACVGEALAEAAAADKFQENSTLRRIVQSRLGTSSENGLTSRSKEKEKLQK
jgi:hypothetical protein